MRKLKRVLSFMLAAIMMISMSGMNVMAAEQQETREGYVEIALDNAASTYSTNYYSKGLVVLNIATAGVSNECRITSGSVPDGATITKVELKAQKVQAQELCIGMWNTKHLAELQVKDSQVRQHLQSLMD